MELKQKHKVEEKTDKFIHNIKVTYPKENVASMKKSWTETLEKINDWLDNYNEHFDKTKEQGFQAVEENYTNALKFYEDFELLSDEEKSKKLLEGFYKEKEKFFEQNPSIEVMKEEFLKSLNDEFNKYKQQFLIDKKNKEDALKLWNNPIKK